MTRIWVQNSAVQGIGPVERHESARFEDGLLERDRLRIAEHDPGADVNPRGRQRDAHQDQPALDATAVFSARASPSRTGVAGARRSRLAASSTHASTAIGTRKIAVALTAYAAPISTR